MPETVPGSGKIKMKQLPSLCYIHMLYHIDGPWGNQLVIKGRSSSDRDRKPLLGLGGGKNGELLFIGYRDSVLQDEKSSGDGQWWGLHNNVNVFNATGLST